MIYFHFVAGVHQGKRYPVDSVQITIGRTTDNKVVLPSNDSTISRNHAVILRHGNLLFIRDLNSKNGTFLNGRRIPPNKNENLKVGDSIKIGSNIFTVNSAQNKQSQSSNFFSSENINKIGSFFKTQLINPIKTTFQPDVQNQSNIQKNIQKYESAPTTEIQMMNNDQKGSQLKILEQIASGGMSKIFKALFLDTGEVVAIKLPKSEFKDKKDVLNLFRKEIKMSLRFKHPNIVQTLMEVVYNDMPTMVMEYFPSITFAEVIEKRKILKNQKIILEQIMDAFSYIHGRGIIHNDIKPSNVLINTKNCAKISDFGTAGTPDEIKKMRSEWKLFGTLLYISPEQLKGDPIDYRSDVYSLGLVLYEYFSGSNPFRTENTNAEIIKDKQLNCVPVPLYQVNPTVNPDFSNSIMRAIEKDPDKRQPSIKALQAELIPFL